MKLKRNDVVLVKNFYGRVVKNLPDNRVLVLCCGLHFWSIPVNWPKADYLGYRYKRYDYKPTKRFIYMTSLRKLKKKAARYHGKFAHNTPINYEYIKVL